MTSLNLSYLAVKMMLTKLSAVTDLLVTLLTAVLCASLTGHVLLAHHLWEVITVAPPPVLPGTAVVHSLRLCVSWNGREYFWELTLT